MPHAGEMVGLLHAIRGGGAAEAITPTGSPFTYTATRGGRVLVSGGTVTTVEIAPAGGSFVAVGVVAGQFVVSPFDQVRVTYAIAPTMTFLPT